MTRITIASLLILTFSALSCRQENMPELSLPDITQTGQNTLGFVIDNRIWTNFGRRCTFAGCNDNKVKAEFSRTPNGEFMLSVSAGYSIASQTIDQYFEFLTTNITTTGTFDLDSIGGNEVLFIANRYAQSFKDYKNSLPGKFQLTITRFDTTNRIISGTFGGVLFNRFDNSDSVLLKDGRFDAQLEYRR